MTETTLAAQGYDAAECSHLRICSSCLRLYEEERPDGLNQACDCRPTGERWARHDFNQRADLCSCCALTVLPSGSRWSPFFCRECQLLAMGVSIWERHLIFPIGRHSLMHAWVPEPVRASHANGDPVTGTCRKLQTIVTGSDGVGRWGRLRLAHNLAMLGLKGDIPLHSYLDAMTRYHGEIGLQTRMDAFEGMCEFVRYGDAAPAPAHGR